MSSIQATNPRVAAYLIGTRFDFMHAYNLFDSFDSIVIRTLGGRDAVDIFINTDSSETESRTIEELKKMFAVLSVRALDAAALQNLSSDACPSGTMRYASESGAFLVCNTCAAQHSFSGWRRATVKSENMNGTRTFDTTG
jgi:hypothetical protein